jgi:serine protease Do
LNGRKIRFSSKKSHTAATHPVNHFVTIVRQVRDGVVSLTTTRKPKINDFHETIWSQLFPSEQQTTRQFGSGFIVHPTGFILTNDHVIREADTIWVKVTGYKKIFRATPVWSDPDRDIALIRIHAPRPLKALSLGSSTHTEVGEWVIAVGNPFGLEQTVTVGIISGKNRPLLRAGQRSFRYVIQTDAAINPGNSGGPLINMLGKVIGINTLMIYPSQSIGFAIPIEEVKPLLAKIKDG